MKTTRILSLFIIIFFSMTGLGVAETHTETLPASGSQINRLALDNIPEQITILQDEIESIHLLLEEMSSALQQQNHQQDRLAKQKITPEHHKMEWNYFNSEDFESH